jgi:hypothetical protein
MVRSAAFLAAVGLIGACATTGTGSTTSALQPEPATTTVPTVATTVAEVTTTQPAPTTTVASTTTAATAVFVDVPEECVEAIQTYYVDVQEPLAAYDFETSGWDDFVALQMAMVPGQESLAAALQAPTCADSAGLLNPDNSTALLAWVEIGAPGAVTYLELQRALSDLSMGESCQTSYEDLQAYVDRGGTVADASVVERWHAFSLVAFILTWCDLATGHRFVSRAVVEDFIGANLVG